MDKTVKEVGVSEFKLNPGVFACFDGKKLLLIGEKENNVLVLPGNPKWARNDMGLMVPVIKREKYYPALYELAVNPQVDVFRVKNSLVKLGIKETEFRSRFLLDMAKGLLLAEDIRMEDEMMGKCKWVCKLYRVYPCAMPCDEQPKPDRKDGKKLIEGHLGKIGAIAFQQLCMFGG